MSGGRARLAADVRDGLATARGQARAASAAAESRRAAAHARLRAVREAQLACVKDLGAGWERARQEVEERFLRSARRLADDVLAVSDVDPLLVRLGTVTAPGCGMELPALVPLLGRGHLWFDGDESIVDGVLARALGGVLESVRPGAVRLTVYDPERLGGTLAGLAPLGAADLVRFVGPGGLAALLDGLVEEIQRINASVLATASPSLPWQVVVFLCDGATESELTAAHLAQLDRIVRLGPACGVHLVGRGLPLAPGPTVTRVRVTGTTAHCVAVGDLPIRLDPAPTPASLAAVCRSVAASASSGPPAATFTDLLPSRHWTASAASGLSAPVGTELGSSDLVSLTLGDDPPHALIGGPSGSGKTNFIYAWLGSLCARYSPNELALYLLDFKEGVSFARFAPSPRDPSWLPHTRLVGVNVNEDREFGLALLRHLGEELRTRAQAAKRHEATKLSELRAEDPTGSWPRIVAVIDEFQILLGGRDAVTTEAVTLLEDLARRGRSQGIHLVLASQDVSGIEALWGRSGLVAQFRLRIALPKARRILSETNLAADSIPRFSAVINADSGMPAANRVVRVPDASDRTTWRALQHDLWHARGPSTAPPRLFDGDAVPPLPLSFPVPRAAGDAPDLWPTATEPAAGPRPTGAATGAATRAATRAARVGASLPPDTAVSAAAGGARHPADHLPHARTAETVTDPAGAHTVGPAGDGGYPVALVGETIDVLARPALFPLTRAPGRNLAVLGTRSADATALLTAAALSATRTTLTPRFSVICLDPGVEAAARALHAALPAARWADPSTAAALLGELVADLDAPVPARSHIVVGFACDAHPLGPDLKTVITRGPERHTHVLGWWRTVARLRDDLGGPGARLDPIGGWVALDVQGADLAPLSPQPGGPSWYPRERRALFFDRAAHRAPHVIIPYEVPPARLAPPSPLPPPSPVPPPSTSTSPLPLPAPSPLPAQSTSASPPPAPSTPTAPPPASLPAPPRSTSTPTAPLPAPAPATAATAPAAVPAAVASSGAGPTPTQPSGRSR